jgi:hypothetical protein
VKRVDLTSFLFGWLFDDACQLDFVASNSKMVGEWFNCVCVLCLIVVPLLPGENSFALKINNNNNNYNNCREAGMA